MNQPAKATTVTIIGAGLGGIALVANLGLWGGWRTTRWSAHWLVLAVDDDTSF